MARTTPHLLLSRHCIFYFRLAIPQRLRDAVGGRREVRISLATRDRSLAIIRAHQLSAFAKAQLLQALTAEDKTTGGSMGLDSKIIQKMNLVMPSGHQITDIKPGEEASALALVEKLNGMIAGVNPSHTQSSLAPKQNAITFSELFQKFGEERARGGKWSEKTKKEFTGSVKLAIALMGDLPVDQITRERIRALKDDLMFVPPRARIMPKTRETAVKLMVLTQKSRSLDGGKIQVLSASTINNILGRFHSVFGWARDHGYMTDNPVSGMQIEVSDNEPKRLPFEPDELKTIFRSPIFMEGKYRKPFQYWGPMIAIYSGLRLNEIAQLHLKDIRDVDGVMVLDINAAGGGKKLKTKTSKRLVPVHPILKKLGLIDYAESLKKAGQDRLFPELKYKKDEGYGRRLGDWFNNTLLVDLQIKSKTKVFHSLRHNVATRLQNAHVQESVVQAILGHAHQSESFNRYASGYLPEILLPAVEKLDFGLEHMPFRSKTM